ncbi:MAG: hypothetical protein M1816_001524 [Peltula sp. TS41687]|nr:MAG: hypothetical protein M1816_001524 [Peltula sp. TS41687]
MDPWRKDMDIASMPFVQKPRPRPVPMLDIADDEKFSRAFHGRAYDLLDDELKFKYTVEPSPHPHFESHHQPIPHTRPDPVTLREIIYEGHQKIAEDAYRKYIKASSNVREPVPFYLPSRFTGKAILRDPRRERRKERIANVRNDLRNLPESWLEHYRYDIKGKSIDFAEPMPKTRSYWDKVNLRWVYTQIPAQKPSPASTHSAGSKPYLDNASELAAAALRDTVSSTTSAFYFGSASRSSAAAPSLNSTTSAARRSKASSEDSFKSATSSPLAESASQSPASSEDSFKSATSAPRRSPASSEDSFKSATSAPRRSPASSEDSFRSATSTPYVESASRSTASARDSLNSNTSSPYGSNASRLAAARDSSKHTAELKDKTLRQPPMKKGSKVKKWRVKLHNAKHKVCDTIEDMAHALASGVLPAIGRGCRELYEATLDVLKDFPHWVDRVVMDVKLNRDKVSTGGGGALPSLASASLFAALHCMVVALLACLFPHLATPQ